MATEILYCELITLVPLKGFEPKLTQIFSTMGHELIIIIIIIVKDIYKAQDHLMGHKYAMSAEIAVW